jgi:hypothetical protein
MNARCHDVTETGSPCLHDDARWQLLQRVLASPLFTKAPRMSALLSFLVTRTLNGLAATINEFTIGVEVFRRVARDFDTTIDPVVRVQMGRLRERLARYHAMPDSPPDARIVIPPGSYVPVLTAPGPLSAPRARPRSIGLAPLRMLSSVGGVGSSVGAAFVAEFVAGLEDELALQLFRRFGAAPMRDGSDGVPEDRLEVSVRVDRGLVRAAIRLSEAGSGRLAWLQQCDVHGELGIRLQEALALAICNDLQRHVRVAAGAPVQFRPALPAS